MYFSVASHIGWQAACPEYPFEKLPTRRDAGLDDPCCQNPDCIAGRQSGQATLASFIIPRKQIFLK
jgi:hypothetical protein